MYVYIIYVSIHHVYMCNCLCLLEVHLFVVWQLYACLFEMYRYIRFYIYIYIYIYIEADAYF